jgi:carbonic anhydrase
MKHLLIPIVLFLSQCSHLQQNSSPDWSYHGAHDPSHWHELSPTTRTCAQGHHQSPIDIYSQSTEKLGQKLEFFYHYAPVVIFNNGHTIEFDMTDSNYVILDGKKFQLLEFHFHRHSEHSIDHKFYAAEIHLVHRSEDEEVIVLAYMLNLSQDRDSLGPIFDQIPPKGKKKTTKIHLEAFALENKGRYVYDGSLTTPPCTENVTWLIFQQPLEITLNQLNQFDSYYADNHRPLQKMYLRKVYEAN